MTAEQTGNHVLRNAFGGLAADAAGLILYAATKNLIFPALATAITTICISRIDSYASGQETTTPKKGLRRLLRP